MMEFEIHPVQADILLVLLFKPKARFSQLNTSQMSNDHFTFHLKRLIKEGLVKKDKDFYSLTTKGKEFANRFDTEDVVLERQAKLGVLVVCVRRRKKETEYLVQQRLKEPYFGFYGFVTGKVKWGETIEKAASRELKEETGLSGKIQLLGIKHKMDYQKKDKKLLEDKYFFVFKASQTQGKLKIGFEGGKNIWMNKRDIFKLPHLFDGVSESIEMVSRPRLVFSETKYFVSKY